MVKKAPEKKLLKLIVAKYGIKRASEMYKMTESGVRLALGRDKRIPRSVTRIATTPGGQVLTLTMLKVMVAVRDGLNSVDDIAEYINKSHGAIATAIAAIDNGEIIRWDQEKSRTMQVTPAGREFLKPYGFIRGKLRESGGIREQ